MNYGLNRVCLFTIFGVVIDNFGQGIVKTWTLKYVVIGDSFLVAGCTPRMSRRYWTRVRKPQSAILSRLLVPAPRTCGLRSTSVIGDPYLVAGCCPGRS